VYSHLLAQASEPDTLDYIERGGIIGVGIVLFWLLATKRLVMGWYYNEMKEDRDKYRQIALSTVETGEKATATAEQVVQLLKRDATQSN